MSEPGFEIKGRFYPQPQGYTLPDTVLIYEVTGMELEEFAAALDIDAPGYMRAFPGMIAVAVWRVHKNWRREKVLSFLQEVALDDIVPVGMEEEEEGEASPPQTEEEPTPGSEDSETSADKSGSDSGSPSEGSSLTSSGSLRSVTGLGS